MIRKIHNMMVTRPNTMDVSSFSGSSDRKKQSFKYIFELIPLYDIYEFSALFGWFSLGK